MKIIAKYIGSAEPPVLSLWIHDAPHRRMHRRVLEQYRVALRTAIQREIGGSMPIAHPIEMTVLFVNPATPDLGNAYLALEMALDDKTLTKPGIVADDSLIQKVVMSKFFPEGEKKR